MKGKCKWAHSPKNRDIGTRPLFFLLFEGSLDPQRRQPSLSLFLSFTCSAHLFFTPQKQEKINCPPVFCCCLHHTIPAGFGWMRVEPIDGVNAEKIGQKPGGSAHGWHGWLGWVKGVREATSKGERRFDFPLSSRRRARGGRKEREFRSCAHYFWQTLHRQWTHDQITYTVHAHTRTNKTHQRTVDDRRRNLLRSLSSSERNKSLAEAGCGSGRLPASLTRIDSEDWKIHNRNPSTKVRPIDLTRVHSACSISNICVCVCIYMCVCLCPYDGVRVEVSVLLVGACLESVCRSNGGWMEWNGMNVK